MGHHRHPAPEGDPPRHPRPLQHQNVLGSERQNLVQEPRDHPRRHLAAGGRLAGQHARGAAGPVALAPLQQLPQLLHQLAPRRIGDVGVGLERQQGREPQRPPQVLAVGHQQEQPRVGPRAAAARAPATPSASAPSTTASGRSARVELPGGAGVRRGHHLEPRLREAGGAPARASAGGHRRPGFAARAGIVDEGGLRAGWMRVRARLRSEGRRRAAPGVDSQAERHEGPSPPPTPLRADPAARPGEASRPAGLRLRRRAGPAGGGPPRRRHAPRHRGPAARAHPALPGGGGLRPLLRQAARGGGVGGPVPGRQPRRGAPPARPGAGGGAGRSAPLGGGGGRQAGGGAGFRAGAQALHLHRALGRGPRPGQDRPGGAAGRPLAARRPGGAGQERGQRPARPASPPRATPSAGCSPSSAAGGRSSWATTSPTSTSSPCRSAWRSASTWAAGRPAPAGTCPAAPAWTSCWNASSGSPPRPAAPAPGWCGPGAGGEPAPAASAAGGDR